MEYWLYSIRARAPDSPIVIVGTHLDSFKGKDQKQSLAERLDRMVSKYARRFPNIHDFALVSCQDRTNIRELTRLLKMVSEWQRECTVCLQLQHPLLAPHAPSLSLSLSLYRSSHHTTPHHLPLLPSTTSHHIASPREGFLRAKDNG